ncbi:WHG domain-containing protein [Sphaerisporangium sp. NPDC088356]|uniref:TetR/AcrR family transcriptional regulator n=1 Tax=Sphaerisporangium sp. NPDC088356 TaxID=3154871 RepID=UPI003421D6A8
MATHVGLTVDRLTRAGADLADQVGLDKITVSALARLFGVADASLYSHIKNVRDLRTRIAVLAADELAEHISAAIAGRSGKEALVVFAHTYRKYALTHPGRYTAVQMPLPPEVAAESKGHRRIVELSYAMLHAYELVEPDLTDAVRLLRSTFHGFVSLEQIRGFGDPRDVQASWKRAIEVLHLSLQNWPSLRNQEGQRHD